jgi:RNA polymerase sigma-70 factor (ECF subfamily)
MGPDEVPPSDASLLVAVALRDETAFSQLYDRFSSVIFALVLRMLRSRTDAEEVLQEAFWLIWERAPSYRETLGSPFAWIVTIARNKAIDRLRALSRNHRRLDQARALGDPDDQLTDAQAPHQLAATDEARLVRAALAKLSPPERHAIELSFFEGLTQEEIARATSLPLGTVKARIRRGMMKLREPLVRLCRAERSTPSS